MPFRALLRVVLQTGLEAVEIAATALRQEESADDDRIFENKVGLAVLGVADTCVGGSEEEAL